MIPINWPGLIGAGIALAAAAGAVTWGVNGIYSRGYDAGATKTEARHAAQLAAAHAERAAAFERAANAERDLRAIEATVDARIAAARRQAATSVRTVKESVNANPTFAACLRPDPVRRVRDDDHRAIADAAARGADLSARILPGLRTADPGKRGDAR